MVMELKLDWNSIINLLAETREEVIDISSDDSDEAEMECRWTLWVMEIPGVVRGDTPWKKKGKAKVGDPCYHASSSLTTWNSEGSGLLAIAGTGNRCITAKGKIQLDTVQFRGQVAQHYARFNSPRSRYWEQNLKKKCSRSADWMETVLEMTDFNGSAGPAPSLAGSFC
nr:hypothetical protein Iba_chr14dCG5960 [Ipomoea batatas]